jgi:N-acyl-D-aspartate/D-glutamate deacylase
VLEHYVRDTGLLTLEDAVHRMTQLPAKALGLTNRGTLAVGNQADLVVFDPESIHDRSTPTEMARHPVGIDVVLVNGTIAADESGVTGAGAGLLAT